MIPPPEAWVLCDGATHPRAPADALHLTLGKYGQSMTVGIDGIDGKLTGRLTPRFNDLIRIAAFVLGADGAFSRGMKTDDDGGEGWHRCLHLVVGVDDPSFWAQSDVVRALEETLGFLSQDTFRFEFQPRGQKLPHQLVFSGPEGAPVMPWDHVEEISLFSGGLDSFAGAADLILGKKRRAILVSHRSAAKVWHIQKDLVEELRGLTKEHGCPAPEHVAVEVARHDTRLRTEHSQRTRSFLYAAIAGAVATLIGRDRICMYENGIIAINLPVAGSVVGARATRTAHPRVVIGFGKILSLVAGRSLQVNNPFVLKTRAEIIQGLASSPALHLVKRTISCAHVHKQSKMHPHCGVCSQCIDRQFGFLGADMQAHDSEVGYEVQLTRDEWTNDSARSLLLNWIGVADKYAACSNSDEFLESSGDAARAVSFLMQSCKLDAEAANRAIYDLHKRHGEAVGRVLEKVTSRSAKEIRIGKLKPNTLPMLLFRRGMQKQAVAAQSDVLVGVENQFKKVEGKWRIRFRGGPIFHVPETKGLLYLSFLLSRPGEARTTAALVALSEGRDPSQCARLDDSGKEIVRARVKALEKDRDEAEEFSDEETVKRCQAEIDALAGLLRDTSSVPPAEKSVAQAAEKEVRLAVAAIAKQSKHLGDHLAENLQIGSVFWYRRPGVAWDFGPRPAASDSPDSEWVHARELVNKEVHIIRSVREVGRFCEQRDVPTRRGKTKDGRDHPQRLRVHAPTFNHVLRRFRAEERTMQDAADRALTERTRNKEKK